MRFRNVQEMTRKILKDPERGLNGLMQLERSVYFFLQSRVSYYFIPEP